MKILELMEYIKTNTNYVGSGTLQEREVLRVIKRVFRNNKNYSPVISKELYKSLNPKLFRKLSLTKYYQAIKSGEIDHSSIQNFSVMQHPCGGSNSPDLMVKIDDKIYSIEIKSNKKFDLFELGTSYLDPDLYISWFIKINNEKHFALMSDLVSPKLRNYFNEKKALVKKIQFLEAQEMGGKVSATIKFSLTSQKLNEVFRGRI